MNPDQEIPVLSASAKRPLLDIHILQAVLAPNQALAWIGARTACKIWMSNSHGVLFQRNSTALVKPLIGHS